MTLSKNFNRAEFACTCGCGFDSVDAETLEVLEAVRMRFGAPVVITSGCRCMDHNRRVGGTPGSQHVLARAADFRVQGIEPQEVYDFIDWRYPDQYGLGLYSTWVHIDTRTNGPARW